jgi:hypothetical protein
MSKENWDDALLYDPRWRRQIEKVTFWSNIFDIGNFSPVPTMAGVAVQIGIPLASPNCVSGDLQKWYCCLIQVSTLPLT